MRIDLRHGLLAMMMSVALFAGCQKPDNPNPPEVKPPVDNPEDNPGAEPVGDDYSGWNTTGKFIPVDEDATLNPNFLSWSTTLLHFGFRIFRPLLPFVS